MSGKTAGAGPPKGVAPKAAINDILAVNRTVELPSPASMPEAPAGYTPTDADVRRKALRFVDVEQHSELAEALREVAQLGPAQVKEDLGDVPDPTDAGVLANRLTTLSAICSRLQSVLDCYTELELIALSDAVLLADAYKYEYDHFLSKRPQLATRYPKLVKFYTQKSAKISDGRARAKAEEEATAAAVAKAKAEGK